MAKLVDDHIIGEVRGQKRELVVEVEVAALRAASPARFLILDEYALVRKAVVGVMRHKPLMDKRTCHFFVREIVLCRLPLCPPSFSSIEPHVKILNRPPCLGRDAVRGQA